MRNVWMATAVVCLAVSPAFASDCEALPAKGKAESEHAATDCVRFNTMNAEYTVLVGDKTSDKALENTYAATLKKICIRKSSWRPGAAEGQ
ncbi:hypothetical protein [Myxococcus xanthus]|nr:hypothetical protein [Myxococcus xanthus]